MFRWPIFSRYLSLDIPYMYIVLTEFFSWVIRRKYTAGYGECTTVRCLEKIISETYMTLYIWKNFHLFTRCLFRHKIDECLPSYCRSDSRIYAYTLLHKCSLYPKYRWYINCQANKKNADFFLTAHGIWFCGWIEMQIFSVSFRRAVSLRRLS